MRQDVPEDKQTTRSCHYVWWALPSILPSSVGIARQDDILERKDHWNGEGPFFVTWCVKHEFSLSVGERESGDL